MRPVRPKPTIGASSPEVPAGSPTRQLVIDATAATLVRIANAALVTVTVIVVARLMGASL